MMPAPKRVKFLLLRPSRQYRRLRMDSSSMAEPTSTSPPPTMTPDRKKGSMLTIPAAAKIAP